MLPRPPPRRNRPAVTPRGWRTIFLISSQATATISAPVTTSSTCLLYTSNIQDNGVLHTDAGFPSRSGRGCTIGHGAILHGCTIGDNTLVGMGAIVLNGAKIGRDCIIGAGALVPQGMEIPDGSLAFGSPAKVRRALTEEEVRSNRAAAEFYCREAAEYAE